jgi:hypothetical protein
MHEDQVLKRSYFNVLGQWLSSGKQWHHVIHTCGNKLVWSEPFNIASPIRRPRICCMQRSLHPKFILDQRLSTIPQHRCRFIVPAYVRVTSQRIVAALSTISQQCLSTIPQHGCSIIYSTAWYVCMAYWQRVLSAFPASSPPFLWGAPGISDRLLKSCGLALAPVQ